ncbi:MAG: DNA primase [Parcubacteria group bacterium CG1_02_39_15]|nr:MAG: DNA primase [Parcubacteria group bacterium CG1_02_39_15]
MISSPVDEIKNRLDIIEVIGSYIKLHKAGANYRALCPFHSEKTPSFFVSPARQIWHCFGCLRGGDIFGFVKEIEGVEFGDALRILAQRAGVELKKQTPEYAKWRSERERLYEICELTTKFFEKQLEESKVGKEAKKYLLSRGIAEESIRKWRLGYSPDVWQSLSDFLTSKNYKKEEIERAGLSIKSEKGSFYDRFRGRIVFPIFDLNSQVVGFSGRVFKSPDTAKYVNTPSTLLYDKSRILYGLDKAKVAVRKKDLCILVEGNTDVIMSHQAGSENAVATSGTALTPFQLKILKRYSNNLLIGFDMDIAGETATKRGIDLAQSQGFDIKIIRLPEGKDPAEIISKNPKAWEKALETAVSILDFYFETAFANRDPKTPEGKKAISKILLPVIKRIPNEIEKSYWVQKLAEKLEVKEEDIEEELKKVKLEEEIYGLEPEEIINLPQRSRKDLLEERLMILILKFPQHFNLIEKELVSCLSPQAQEFFVNFQKDPKFQSKDLSPEITGLFNYISLKAEIEEMEEKEILPDIQFCLREIQCLNIKNKLDQISLEIKKAEEAKDSKKIEELSQEFNKLAKGIV